MLNDAGLMDYTPSCLVAVYIIKLFTNASKTISNVLELLVQRLELWICELLGEMRQLCVALAH